MLVKFLHMWFAPTISIQRDKIQSISGKRYKKGIHEISDDFEHDLPSTAEILSKRPDVVVEPVLDNLQDYDEVRKGDDLLRARLAEGEEAAEILANKRRENMAKARAKIGKKNTK